MEKSNLYHRVQEVLVSRQELDDRILKLASQIHEDCQRQKIEDILCVGVLRGAFIFLADLVRALARHHLRVEVDFVQVKSYEGTESKDLSLVLDLKRSVENKNVILIEDIVDTGKTVSFLKEMLLLRQPASLKICSLLEKPDVNNGKVYVDYLGFAIPPRFVVGYGLDFDGAYRHLDEIRIYSPPDK